MFRFPRNLSGRILVLNFPVNSHPPNTVYVKVHTNEKYRDLIATMMKSLLHRYTIYTDMELKDRSRQILYHNKAPFANSEII